MLLCVVCCGVVMLCVCVRLAVKVAVNERREEEDEY